MSFAATIVYGAKFRIQTIFSRASRGRMVDFCKLSRKKAFHVEVCGNSFRFPLSLSLSLSLSLCVCVCRDTF
jgi:hypothetical protein